MNPDLAIISDGKKFLWDGRACETREEAVRLKETYQAQGFDVQMVPESGKYLLYSRRVVKEVVVAAP